MNRVFKKILLFLSPYILIVIIQIIVDPYNLFSVSNIIPDETKKLSLIKKGFVSPRAEIIWQIKNYKDDPTPNIILGDSRTYDLSDEALQKYFSTPTTNLSIPGGTYYTMIDLFWMAAETTELENAIFHVNFNRYNTFLNNDIYSNAEKLVNAPWNLFMGHIYFKDTYDVLWNHLTDFRNYTPRIFENQETNWEFSKQMLMKELVVDSYIYPLEIFQDLKEISAYCNDHNINLYLVNTPYYHEVHDYIKKFGLEERYTRFINDMITVSPFINLDNGIPLSYEKDNYFDFFHLRRNIVDTLVYLGKNTPPMNADMFE